MKKLLIPRFSQFSPQLAFALTFSLINLWGNSICGIVLAVTVENSLTIVQNQPELGINFRLPPRGAPGPRDTAGSRDPSNHIVALIPGTNFGFTTQEYPSLWVFFPYTTIQEVKFTLKDAEDRQIYQQEFSLPGTPGFVEIKLPKTIAPLEIDQVYFWNLEVGLKPYGNLDNPIIRGGIERVVMDNDLQSQLAGKSEQEKLGIYAQNGLWFDVVSGLITLRQSNPHDEEVYGWWVSLLQQIGLKELNNQSLVKLP